MQINIYELYRNTFRSTYYLALKVTGNENAAMQIVSESYRNAFSSIDSLQNPEGFDAWIKQITAICCVEFLRQSNQFDYTDMANPSVRIEDGEEFLPVGIEKSANAVVAVNKTIDAFPASQKLVAMLYYYCGMQTSYIAQLISCSEEKVRNDLYSVREKTKQYVERMINRGIPVHPLAGRPLLSEIILSEGNQIVADETLMNNIFMSASNGASANPAKEKKPSSANGKKIATAVICAVLVVAIIVAGVIVVPKFIPKKETPEEDTTAPNISAEMLKSIEANEERYENILTEFSESLRSDGEISDGGFNFVYLNDNDVPDLALNYKKESSFSEGVVEDTVLVYIDGTNGETFEIDSNKMMFGEKGHFVVAEVETYGGEVSEGYFKYKYIDDETKEFCGGVKYDRYSDGAQGYSESWTYATDRESEVIKLSGMEEYEQKKNELISGFISALYSYDIEDYIESGEKLIKYLKKAETVYFGTGISSPITNPAGFSTENQSFTSALTDESTLSAPSITGISSAPVIEAKDSDWKMLAEDMNVLLTYNGKYNYISDDAYEIVLSEYASRLIYWHYFKKDFQEQFKNDPLGHFEYSYVIYDAEDIDWLVSNIFNQTPNHNLKNKSYYYHNGKYYALFSPSGPPISEISIAGKQKQSDGSYLITVKEFSYDAAYAEEEMIEGILLTYTVKAALKNIDGKRYWSFYSIVNTDSKETTSKNPDYEETTTVKNSENQEWKKTYQEILKDKFNINKRFLLMDLDRNGTPDLFLLDTSAQTDFCDIYMNGNGSEEDSLIVSFSGMYINGSGDFGFYNIYHSGGEYREAYYTEVFNGSKFVTVDSISHFKGYENAENKTGSLEYWEYFEGDSEEGKRITEEEFNAYAQKIKKEYREVNFHSVHDYLESGNELEEYIYAY